MAELEKKFFGTLKGSLGDIVFRSRNEKNYVSHKPKSYTAPDDDNYRERTGKFKIAVKLASAIYSFNNLKNIWLENVPAGKTAFSYLMQINYPFVESADLKNMVAMTPESSFAVNVQNLTLNSTALSIELAPFGDVSNVDSSLETKVQLLAVVFLHNPAQPDLPDYNFIKLTSTKQSIDLVNPITFNMPLLTAQKSSSDNYTNKKVLFTALTFDDNDLMIQYSSTVNYMV